MSELTTKGASGHKLETSEHSERRSFLSCLELTLVLEVTRLTTAWCNGLGGGEMETLKLEPTKTKASQCYIYVMQKIFKNMIITFWGCFCMCRLGPT